MRVMWLISLIACLAVFGCGSSVSVPTADPIANIIRSLEEQPRLSLDDWKTQRHYPYAVLCDGVYCHDSAEDSVQINGFVYEGRVHFVLSVPLQSEDVDRFPMMEGRPTYTVRVEPESGRTFIETTFRYLPRSRLPSLDGDPSLLASGVTTSIRR